MATRIVTTDPKPSNKSPDFYYVRFNDRTPVGTEKTFSFSKSLAGIIRKNYAFDDSALKWQDPVGWVLQLDFDGAPGADPQLPPDAETGWSDPDHLAAILPEPVPQHAIPNRGVTPETARRRLAAERAAEFNMPMDFLARVETLCKGQLYIQKRIGVSEKPRAQEAQKILMAAWIDWRKDSGAIFTEDEEKAMQF
jgi:hypothetical protein